MRGAAWNPWRALRQRTHIGLLIAALPAGTRAVAIEAHPEHHVVVLDRSLNQLERNAALTHELVHLERGLLPKGAPDHVVAREESAVRRIAAERLVDRPALLRLIEVAEAEGWGLEPWEIVDELGLPERDGPDILDLVWPDHRTAIEREVG